MELENAIIEVPLQDIIPNRFQPRLSFDEKALNELSDSIKQHGIIQPLVLRKLGDKYEIIAGERRYKAAGMAGLAKVPAVVANIDDNASAEVALVENLQRKNLTAIEEAKSYKGLLDKGYLTQEQLAKRIGVSQSAISNKLRLLNLDDAVQESLLNEQISERHARALLALDNKEDQRDWLDRIVRERMTVRQLDLELKKLKQEEGDGNTDVPLVNLTPDIEEIKATATDINPEPEPKIVENFFPERDVEIITPEVKKQEYVDPNAPAPRKFFNFLEDEEANLDTSEVISEIQVPEPPKVEEIIPEPSGVQILDESLPETNTDEAPINQVVSEPIIFPEEPTVEVQEVLEPEIPIITETLDVTGSIPEPVMPTIEPTNVNEPLMPEIENSEVIEITPFAQDSTLADLTPPLPTPSPENLETLESLTPTVEAEPITNTIMYNEMATENENLVDPVNMIDQLDPNYEEKQKEASGTDLKSGINILRDTVKSLESRGFKIDSDEIDFDDSYQVIIKIEK